METKWTKEYIMERLNEHYQDALKIYPEEQIIGIFLQGSQNYGVAYEGSDVDTKLLIAPQLDDLCRGTSPVSKVYVRTNDEHIDVKDIRYITTLLAGENPSYLEILCTDYYIINPQYKELFKKLRAYRDIIPQANMNKFLKSIRGMAHEKYHALKHEYPSKFEVIAKFGYDPKQLHHLIRLHYFLDKFLKTYRLSSCYDTGDHADYLIKVKRGKYTLEEAEKISKIVLESIDKKVEKFITNNPQYDKKDYQVFDAIEQIQILLMKTYITNKILQEKGEQ